MINVYTAKYIFYILISLLSYYFSININGIIQSIFNSKCGDFTGKLLGYNSFNPLLYLNVINLLFLFILRIPLPVDVPLNIFNISYKYRNLKLFLIFSVPFLTNLFLSIIALFLINFYGINIEFLNLILDLNAKGLASIENYYSGLSIVIATFLYVVFIYNIRMAVFNFVLKLVEFFLVINFKINSKYFQYITIFVPFIVFTFLGGYLNYFILNLVVFISNYFIIFKNYILNY